MMSTLMERDMRSDKQEIAVLHTDISKLEADNRRLLLENSQLKLRVQLLENERGKEAVVPTGDEDGYECPNMHCNAELTEDMRYCPSCGCHIDWRTWVGPEPDIDQWRDR